MATGLPFRRDQTCGTGCTGPPPSLTLATCPDVVPCPNVAPGQVLAQQVPHGPYRVTGPVLTCPRCVVSLYDSAVGALDPLVAPIQIFHLIASGRSLWSPLVLCC